MFKILITLVKFATGYFILNFILLHNHILIIYGKIFMFTSIHIFYYHVVLIKNKINRYIIYSIYLVLKTLVI